MDYEGRYIRIKSRFWSDEKVLTWDNDTKFLALYLMTSKHNTILGCCILPKLYICADLGWSEEQLAEPFAKLLEDGFMQYDDHNRLLLINNFLEHNPIVNGNQAIAAKKVLMELPKSPLLQDLKRFIERLDKPFLKRLAELIGDPVTVTVTVSVTEEKDLCAPSPAAQGALIPEAPAEDEQEEKPVAVKGERDLLFERIWQIYPIKRERQKALDLWRKEKLDSLFDVIRDAVERQNATKKANDAAGKFYPEFPHLHRWLKGRRWTDELNEEEGQSHESGAAQDNQSGGADPELSKVDWDKFGAST